MKKFLLTVLLTCSSLVVNAVPRQITGNRLVTPSDLAQVELYHDTNHFYVIENGKKSLIENYQLDKELRDIDSLSLDELLGSEQLDIQGLTEEEAVTLIADPKTIVLTEKEFEDIISVHSGYLKLKKYSDGSYGLSSHIRMLGGGPLFGKIMYWAVKIVCYSVIITAVAATAASTGGSIIAAVSPLLPKALVSVIAPTAINAAAGAAGAAAGVACGATPVAASIAGGALIGGLTATPAVMAASTTGAAALVGACGSVPAVLAATECVAAGVGLVAASTYVDATALVAVECIATAAGVVGTLTPGV